MNTVVSRGFGTLALAGCLLASGSARAASAVPPGTSVTLEFTQAVSSKTAKRGDQVPMRVYSDVMVNGKAVVREGASATGVVEEVKKPGRFGKKGALRMRLTSVRDVNGVDVPLEPYSTGKRFDAGGPGAAGAGLLVLGPVGLVGGIFVKGGNVTVNPGTRFEARVAGAKAASAERN